MAKTFRNIRQRARQDSGFGANASGRFVMKNGIPNVQHTGVPPLERFSWYHTMINLSSARFICYLLLGYIAVNIGFALLYFAIGAEHLTGINRDNAVDEFVDVFFFSSQTFTTVGYGRIAPVGFMASLVSTFEAFLGLLAFAIATGLFYGRFSRPRAYLKFSENVLISPYLEGTAMMFRVAPYKNNLLTDAEILVTAAIESMENGEKKSNFYRLNLELPKINTLSLNWTIVHKIDEDSPFHGFTEADFHDKDTDIELVVQLRAFDEIFANTVMQRSSYINAEIVYGAKFRKMFQPSKDGKTTVMDLSKINTYDRVALPQSL